MDDDIEKLRPHRLTSDVAPVSYRAIHIRRLFKLIDELRNRISTLEVQNGRMREERDAARSELDGMREALLDEQFERDISAP